MTDYYTQKWQRDINTFGKLREMFGSATTDWIKVRIRSRMADIQKAWPRHIKESELP